MISQHGLKHWSFAARRDAVFMADVAAATTDLPESTPFALRVYCAAYGVSPVCENGKTRPLKSIEKGLGFCGPTGKCECARAHISKTSKAIDHVSRLAKTKATLKERYGSENPGQTPSAKEKHREFYTDASRVEKATAKSRATMLARHGVENGFQLPSIDRKANANNRSSESKARGRKAKAELASSGHFLRQGYDRVVARLPDSLTLVTPPRDYRGAATLHYYDFSCQCGETFSDYIKDGHQPRCFTCDPPEKTIVSKEEVEVADFMAQFGRVVRSDRRMIRPNELDIVMPEHKLAVEYCGLYWHSEFGSGKIKNYHLDKLKAVEDKGYRLITIFSDEWINQRGIVESRLRHAIGGAAPAFRIGARKTVVRKITRQEASAFFAENHIQGSVSAPHNYGLFDEERLVSAMSFGPLRRLVNTQDKKGWFELYRFASPGSVVGGASKLFNAFIREQDPDGVISYCDRRWGQGGTYRALGFQTEKMTAPGYWWLTDRYTKRSHRYNFTKHKLVENGGDPEMTEVEIMKARGADRIWDCGSIKFVWNKAPSSDK